MPEFVELRIKRQKDPFRTLLGGISCLYKKNLNVITLLQEIQRNPVNVKDELTTPVALDCSCLEEVCGACTMIMNGQWGRRVPPGGQDGAAHHSGTDAQISCDSGPLR